MKTSYDVINVKWPFHRLPWLFRKMQIPPRFLFLLPSSFNYLRRREKKKKITIKGNTRYLEYLHGATKSFHLLVQEGPFKMPFNIVLPHLSSCFRRSLYYTASIIFLLFACSTLFSSILFFFLVFSFLDCIHVLSFSIWQTLSVHDSRLPIL